MTKMPDFFLCWYRFMTWKLELIEKYWGGCAGFYPSTFVYSCFFPQRLSFYCFHENAFLKHFLALKHTLSFADKQWFGNKVHKIPSPKFVHESWQPTPKSAFLVGHTNFFCNYRWQSESVMFSLKLLLLKKNFMTPFCGLGSAFIF